LGIKHGQLQQVGAGQTVQIIALPDLVGWVVQVHSVRAAFESFTAVTATFSLLAHNIGLGFTFQTGEADNAWAQNPMIGDGPAMASVERFHEPYELIGPQRWVVINSAGTVVIRLSISYSMRREPNRTLWNEIRRRTSYSTG